MHAKEKMYVPELIFGTLLTSSNYNDDQKKVTGGRNGYGAKLCNIFSTEFTVETACSESGKLFKQVTLSVCLVYIQTTGLAMLLINTHMLYQYMHIQPTYPEPHTHTHMCIDMEEQHGQGW